MDIRILIPTPLRPYTNNKEEVTLTLHESQTIGATLNTLTQQYETLKPYLYDDQNNLRKYINIYVNDDDIRYMQQESTPVKQGDTISLIPAIAGGS